MSACTSEFAVYIHARAVCYYYDDRQRVSSHVVTKLKISKAKVLMGRWTLLRVC